VTLLVQPREVVVGGDGEIEAGLFGTHQVVNKLPRPALLAHHRVTDLHHARPLTRQAVRKRRLRERASMSGASGVRLSDLTQSRVARQARQ
jgi:hypothetical protein